MIQAAPLIGVCTHYMRVPEAHGLGELLERLTPAERARADAIRSDTRRREHVASRALVKYQVLNRFDERDDLAREIAVAHLSEISAEKYREIEVLRADGAPRVFQHGVAIDGVHLSIAHGAGMAAAAISADSPVGIDVATVEAHASSFRRIHYSEAERDWIACADAASSDTLFTLLWTLKECAIKAGAAPEATLWGYDEVEVLIDTDARVVADNLDAGLSVHMTMKLPFGRVGSAGATRIANTILSFVAGIQEA